MGIILQPGTVQRVKGAAMFVPVIAAFMLSRDGLIATHPHNAGKAPGMLPIYVLMMEYRFNGV